MPNTFVAQFISQIPNIPELSGKDRLWKKHNWIHTGLVIYSDLSCFLLL